MKDLDLKKNIINLTHTDMDGSGCSILSKLVFSDRDVIHTSYGRIADILEFSPRILLEPSLSVT